MDIFSVRAKQRASQIPPEEDDVDEVEVKLAASFFCSCCGDFEDSLTLVQGTIICGTCWAGCKYVGHCLHEKYKGAEPDEEPAEESEPTNDEQ